MKLLQSIGPNPHVVKLFIAEKVIEVERQEIDLMKGENRQQDYLAINPAGQLPALVLDNDNVISERPGCGCVASTMETMANGFRYSEGLQLFESRMTCLPEAADGLKRKAKEYLTWLDGQFAPGPFVCGERYSLADMTLYCFVTFGGTVGQPLDPGLSNLGAWYVRMQARDAVKATG